MSENTNTTLNEDGENPEVQAADEKTEGANKSNGKEDAKVKTLDTEKNGANEFREKFYYLAAEMENLKKRQQREIESTIKFSNEKLLKSLVTVLDNFDRTLEALKKDVEAETEKMKQIISGVEMVKKQMESTLQGMGLTSIESLGKTFDPNLHEALSEQVVEGKKAGEIIIEYQRGFLLNGRLLRAAKVVVAKES